MNSICRFLTSDSHGRFLDDFSPMQDAFCQFLRCQHSFESFWNIFVKIWWPLRFHEYIIDSVLIFQGNFHLSDASRRPIKYLRARVVDNLGESCEGIFDQTCAFVMYLRWGMVRRGITSVVPGIHATLERSIVYVVSLKIYSPPGKDPLLSKCLVHAELVYFDSNEHHTLIES